MNDNYKRRNSLLGRFVKRNRPKIGELKDNSPKHIIKSELCIDGRVSYGIAVVEVSISLKDHGQSVYLLEGDNKDQVLVIPKASTHPGTEYKLINSSLHTWELYPEDDKDIVPLEVGRMEVLSIISDGVKKWWRLN